MEGRKASWARCSSPFARAHTLHPRHIRFGLATDPAAGKPMSEASPSCDAPEVARPRFPHIYAASLKEEAAKE